MVSLYFIVSLMGVDPSRTVNMIQAEKTSELMQYMEQISGVMNYVNQMFSFLANCKR